MLTYCVLSFVKEFGALIAMPRAAIPMWCMHLIAHGAKLSPHTVTLHRNYP